MAAANDRLARRILAGLVIGLVAGVAVRGLAGVLPEDTASAWLGGAGWVALEILDPVGQVFLRLLFFVVLPLVFASLALGVCQLGRLDRLGPMAGRTFALFGFNMAVGVGLGLLFMNLVEPGHQIDAATRDQLVEAYRGDAGLHIATSEAQRAGGFNAATVVEMFMPRNLFGAIVGNDRGRIGDVLPLIVFALLVGAAGTALAPDRRAGLQAGLQTTADLMTTIVGWALRLAPLAVACLVGSVVIKFGVEFLQALLLFAAGLLVVMAIHAFGTMALLVRVFGRRSAREFFRAAGTVLATAFSTSSSNATLPTTIAVARERLGVSAPVAGFVLPLGATMNMAGTALYEGAVVLFAAQVFGIELGIGSQLILLLLSVLSAVAVAGIPGGSLPLIVGLMTSFGIPAEGIALVLGIDRILDMARTAVNVVADLATATVVDRLEAGSAATSASPP